MLSLQSRLAPPRTWERNSSSSTLRKPLAWFSHLGVHVYLSEPRGEQGRSWGIELNVPLSLCVPSHTAFLTPAMDLTAQSRPFFENYQIQ